jgi:hypothetical protein
MQSSLCCSDKRFGFMMSNEQRLSDAEATLIEGTALRGVR